MNPTTVKYVVNGKVSTVISRLQASKTFWICLAFVLAAADKWNKGEMSGAQLLSVCQVGVIGILIRSAMAKAELASNAANQDVQNVEVKEVPKQTGTGVTTALLALLCVGCLSLAGCGRTAAALQTPDGKPIVSGEICANTPNGRICYKPNEPTVVAPEPTPPPTAVAVGPPVAVGPIAAAPLVVKQPALEK